jgi:hypothetical protein
MRKARSSHVSQQLRGSGDFSAWSDSAIYITRHGDDRLLTIEHRTAAPPPPIVVRLQDTPAPHLVIVDADAASATTESLHRAILEHLEMARRPQSALALRNAVKVRKASLIAALEVLRKQGLVKRTSAGWTAEKEGA